MLVSLLCIVVSTMLVALVLTLVGIDSANAEGKVENLLLSGLFIVAPLAGLAAYLRWRGISFSALKINSLSRKQAAKIVQGLIYYFLLSLALLQLADLLTSVDLTQDQDLGLVEPTSMVEFGLMFLLLVILTPATEEVLFRGYMFRGFAKSWGWLPAAIISAGLFGLMHWQLNVALDTAALGFISAWLVHETGSLTPSILLHAVKNLAAFSLIYGPALLS